MAKQKKSNEQLIPPVSREAIAAVKSEEDFVELLRRELEWPIPINVERLDDVAIPHDLQQDFGFKPEEDRIAVSRLLNLTEEQPWGVFLFEFKTKRPYLSHLRQLLRVLGSQRTLRRGDPVWDCNDLLFICTPDWQQFQFVHFAGAKPENALISSFGWKGQDDPFLYTLCKHNLPRLRMPQPGEGGGYDADAWRTAWLEAFSIKPVTDEFYTTLKEVFDAVQSGVIGLEGENRRFFAELVVNRMVFLKFVEKKGWLAGDHNYLYKRFQSYGRKNYWHNFLCDFFFEGLCKDKDQRTKEVNDLLGDVPFLNAELFAPSDKWDDRKVKIENRVFDLLFDKLLNPYNFTVSETSPLDLEVAFNQDLLGYGYEELIADQHGQGAYYTHPTEVNMMCRESLRAYLEGRCPEVDKELIGKLIYSELTADDTVSEADALILYRALHNVTIVDPALGSGTFPVAMMKHLFLALRTLGDFLAGCGSFKIMLREEGITDPNDAYALKLHIIERSIYGCDIDYFAVQIAKLRFWIELMVECENPEGLPNFNCKLRVGDALVSVVGTDTDGKPVILEHLLGHPTKGQMTLGDAVVRRLKKLKSEYFSERDTTKLRIIEEHIKNTRDELLRSVGIEPTFINPTDKHVLWQIDFAEIFAGEQPGFDIAIANPPYLRQELIDLSFSQMGLSIKKSILRTLYETLVKCKIDGKADIYIYFFLRAFMILKQVNGVHCFICSNSWMDDDFGGCLQEYLTQNCKYALIIEDPYRRAFESADINTVITILINSQNVEKDIKCFFKQMIGVNYSNGLALNLFNDNGIKTQTKTLNDLLPILKTTEGRVKNGKWGARFLRMPTVLQYLLNNRSNQFTSLGLVCDFEYGSKPGIVDFFVVDDNTVREFQIEQHYLLPIITSTREIESLIIDKKRISKLVFVCNESKTVLKQMDHLGALNYIEWGESQRTIKKATHTVSGVKWPEVRSVSTNTPYWYSIRLKRPGHFIVSALIRERFFVAYNQHEFHDTNMFYHGRFYEENDIYLSCALMNTSLSYIMMEIYGRINIGGRINLYGTEYLQLPILNSKYLTMANKEKILEAYKHISKRPILPIRQELRSDDRIEFDTLVLKSFGIDDILTLNNLYELFNDLVENRLTREKMVGE